VEEGRGGRSEGVERFGARRVATGTGRRDAVQAGEMLLEDGNRGMTSGGVMRRAVRRHGGSRLTNSSETQNRTETTELLSQFRDIQPPGFAYFRGSELRV
jgi:hypothetical protein